MNPAVQRVVKSLVRTIAPNVLSLLVLALAHFGLQWKPDADALLLTQQLLAYAIFALLRTLEERGHKRAGFLLGWAGPPRYEKAPPLSPEEPPSGSDGHRSGLNGPGPFPWERGGQVTIDQPTKPSERPTPRAPRGRRMGSWDRFARVARSRGRWRAIRGSRVSAGAVAVLAVLTAFLSVSPAHAEIYGPNVRWASTDVPVKIHVRDVSATRIRAGVHSWDVTNLSPRIGGGSCLDAAGIPQGCVDVSDRAVFTDPTWLAAADRYTLADGTIVGATVRFSGSQRWGPGSSLRVLVDDVAAHEFGHGVGFAHELDPSIPSIMQPIVRDWNGLQPFDVTEAQRLYPFAEPVAAGTVSRYRSGELRVQRFAIVRP